MRIDKPHLPSNSVKMWLWSKLSAKKWLDAWEERFYGNPNTVISELSTGKSLRVEIYCDSEQEALGIQEQFGGSVRELKQENWVAISAAPRPPLKIRDSLIITGEREGETIEELKEKYPTRHLIKMPAEMAFGTGDHATTATCLRLLVDVAKEQEKPWEMLDLGCGTAILAIAARMLGATTCQAHDFDPQAVCVSKENILLNEVNNITTLEQDVLKWQPPRQWDVVIANMFSSILQAAFPTIVQSMKPTGHLIVSGILQDQWQETKESGEKQGLQFTQVIKKGKWTTARAVLVKKN